MNAVTVHKTHTFKWLLKREYWENRGGFLWAPVVTGAIVALLSLIASTIGTVKVLQMKNKPSFNMNIDGPIDEYTRQIGAVGDGILILGLGLAFVVLAFVVFFYCLGTLHDDKRDRSILFWKSLPVSDTAMVLSKVCWALLLAPLLSLVIGVAIGLTLWVIAGASMAISGVPSGFSMFTHSHPFAVVGNALSSLPIYVCWALPTVGWLMFCSAWARSKPFLWAVLVPILACIIISMVGILGLDLPYDKLWYVVAYRGLLSVIPGTWSPLAGHIDNNIQIHSPADLMQVVNLGNNWQLFGTIDMWIGMLVGVAFIVAAIHIRRWRETE
ncbi:hypothetical protein [Pseudoxanthomonas dokdonensis]|uniref:ABC transporter permease n=1 Tax=Pseudoxanthomonas dokdonensis TaxID=344882 RepID=A0A0R0CKX3_9GAMM|nr:hypothetical protein [Pseudoxanthomonas dokdonensis]KRG70652.1 ABC transporter permease [Pseudoxanthomonas dokdonensis]